MADEGREFSDERLVNISSQGRDRELVDASHEWMLRSSKYEYTYNFTWLGRPIIQFPQDIMALQELIWEIRPDVVVETGIARGGSMVFYASLLELIGGDGRVLGIDVDVRAHNRAAIVAHPMAKRITMIEGSSVDRNVVDRVHSFVGSARRVLVVLDSDHTHQHVLRELDIYSGFVRKGSYVVVSDTSIEDAPAGFFGRKPWDKGSNPRTAVAEFLTRNDRFVIDDRIPDKLLITVSPGGYLKCIRD